MRHINEGRREASGMSCLWPDHSKAYARTRSSIIIYYL